MYICISNSFINIHVHAHIHLDIYLKRMLELNRFPELHHHISARRTHQQQREGEQKANSLEASVAHARACGCIRRACSCKPPPAPHASRCTFRLLSRRALLHVSALSHACRRDAAYVSIRQHTSGHVRTRQHTSAYVSRPAARLRDFASVRARCCSPLATSVCGLKIQVYEALSY